MIVIALGPRAQGGEVGARLRLAVAHAMHGFAAEDFREIFLLLRRRAEHHQRVRLDRCANPRRFRTLHGFDEGDLLQCRAHLAAEFPGPA